MEINKYEKRNNSNMPWIEVVRRQLREKVNQVNEFNIILEKVKKEIGK